MEWWFSYSFRIVEALFHSDVLENFHDLVEEDVEKLQRNVIKMKKNSNGLSFLVLSLKNGHWYDMIYFQMHFFPFKSSNKYGS